MEVNMKLLKWSALFFNLFMLIFGPALIAVSLQLVFDSTYSYVFFPQGNFFWGYVIAAIGALITIVGILGCVGTMAENSCLLWTFFAATLLFVGLEIAAGVVIYREQSGFRQKVHFNIRTGVLQQYGTGLSRNTVTDIIQESWKCCGTTGYQSWSLSSFGKQTVFHDSIGDVSFMVPKSCCIDQKSEECRQASQIKGVSEKVDHSNILFNEGCENKLASTIYNYAKASLIIIAILVFVQTISLVLTIILSIAIRSKQGYVTQFSSRQGLNSSHASAPMLSTAESGDLKKQYGVSNPSSVNASRSSLNLELAK